MKAPRRWLIDRIVSHTVCYPKDDGYDMVSIQVDLHSRRGANPTPKRLREIAQVMREEAQGLEGWAARLSGRGFNVKSGPKKVIRTWGKLHRG